MKNFTFSIIFSLLVVSASFAGEANFPREKKKKENCCKTEKSDCKKSDCKKKSCESKTEDKKECCKTEKSECKKSEGKKKCCESKTEHNKESEAK